MSETEWLTCTDPAPMLEFVQGRISNRHCWCFVAACLRRSLPALNYCTTVEEAQRARESVEVLDRVVAGTANDEEVESFYSDEQTAQAWGQALVCSLNAAEQVVSGMLHTRRFANRTAERRSAAREAAKNATRQAERSAQSVLLRCIVGNPFRPTSIDPAWQTSTVLALAQATYDNRSLPGGALDHACLAVLADALEEGGCDNADILTHCRQSGEHVRGCWIVDAILRKT